MRRYNIIRYKLCENAEKGEWAPGTGHSNAVPLQDIEIIGIVNKGLKMQGDS